MKNITRAIIAVLMVAVLSFYMTGCYTLGDYALMADYKKQAKTNAVNYIKEKYGIDAKALDADCKVASMPGIVIDTDPTPSSEVTVKLKYDDKTFYVSITGIEPSTEGVDNYQLEDIKNDIKETLNNIIGVTIEELYVCYGGYVFENPTSPTNGMISEYYDGVNLNNIFGENHIVAVASIINQDIKNFDADLIGEQTGIDWLMLVNYDNKKYYNKINRPYYNLTGSPRESGIEDNLMHVNEYRIIGDDYDEYYYCQKAEFNGVILTTIVECEYLTIQEAKKKSTAEWDGIGFSFPLKVSKAYSINTDAKKIQVYMPLNKIVTLRPSDTKIILQHDGRNETLTTDVTDDYKYLTATIYTPDYYEDLRIAALIDLD